jgi:hypothetical protein
MFRRCLVRGSREPGISPTASTASSRDPGFPVLRKVVQLLAGFEIVDGSADGNLHRNTLAFVAGTLATFAVPTALRLVFGIEAEVQEGIAVDGRHHYDVAASPAVATRRATMRYILLTAEGKATVTAIAGLDRYFYFID